MVPPHRRLPNLFERYREFPKISVLRVVNITKRGNFQKYLKIKMSFLRIPVSLIQFMNFILGIPMSQMNQIFWDITLKSVDF